MGLIGGILTPLYNGFPVALMSPTDFLQQPYHWLQAISHYRGTISPAPNFAYDLCVEMIPPEKRHDLDLSSWEISFNGAEPIRPETLDRFVDAFGPHGFRRETFYPCYGLAESTLIVTGGEKQAAPIVHPGRESHFSMNGSADHATRGRYIVGCGQSWPGQRIEIVDPESCAPQTPGTEGEIFVYFVFLWQFSK